MIVLIRQTWFYRFFERALGWLILLQVGALLLSTCAVFIEAGEQGLLERFGDPVRGRSPLGPGAHLKWPWPIDKVYRFRTERIQSFYVGFAEDKGEERERYVLWSQGHRDETNFLVANRERTIIFSSGGVKSDAVSVFNKAFPIFMVLSLSGVSFL